MKDAIIAGLIATPLVFAGEYAVRQYSPVDLLDRVSFQVEENCSATSIEDTDLSNGRQALFLTAAHCFGGQGGKGVGDYVHIHNQYHNYDAVKIIKLDKEADLALLELTPPFGDWEDAPDYVYLNLDKPHFGDTVCAVGYAFGFDAKAMSCGRISSEMVWDKEGKKKNTYVVQGVAGGMSGGGLFDEDGNLIGVTQAAISTQFEASSTFYFAITGEKIKEFLSGPKLP